MTEKKDKTLFTEFLEAQGEIPTIAKSSKAAYGKYANFDDIVNTVRPILNSHNLFLTQKTTSCELGVSVETVITHISGNSLSSGILTLPVPEGGRGSIAQQCGGLITYAKRYQLCAFLGIATGDDDDGQSLPGGKQTTSKVNAVLVNRATAAAVGGKESYEHFMQSLTTSERAELIQSGMQDRIKKHLTQVEDL